MLDDGQGRASGLRLEENELASSPSGQRAVGTGRMNYLEVGFSGVRVRVLGAWRQLCWLRVPALDDVGIPWSTGICAMAAGAAGFVRFVPLWQAEPVLRDVPAMQAVPVSHVTRCALDRRQ